MNMVRSILTMVCLRCQIQYHDQLGHVADELVHNPDSRRACMIYNRPSIWLRI